MTELAPGARVGAYVVEGVLGRGAHAVVYRVRHAELGIVRALKVLLADDPRLRRRLEQEGRLLARLRHPNIVEVVDTLPIDDRPALVLAFVGGPTLRGLLDRRRFTIPELDEVFGGILAAVGHAHAAGVVHRDLKPANVLFDDESPRLQPLVADFGLARVEDTAGRSWLTARWEKGGSSTYAAPEQVDSLAIGGVVADVWSLGVLLFEMATGTAPFAAGSLAEAVRARILGPRPSARALRPELPARFDVAIAACLQPLPERRPSSVAAVRALLAAEATVDLPAASAPRPRTLPRRRDTTPAPTEVGIARVLLVDPEGRGCVGDVVVVLREGDGVGCPLPLDASTRAAVEVALMTGLPRGRRVEWTLRGADVVPRGGSIALGVRIAVASAIRGRAVPAGWAFTGAVGLDGRVEPVSGLPAKLAAAADAGLTRVGIPASAKVDAPDGVVVIGFTTVEQAEGRVFGGG